MTKRTLSIFIILLIVSCSKKSSNSQFTPGKATLVAPLNNQTCISGTIVSAAQSLVAFSWAASSNTDNYKLVITNLLTKIDTTQIVSTTSVAVKLLRNTPYSWYVTSNSGKTTTVTTSDTWKFYNAGAGIITYPPFPAEIISPTFGEVFDSSQKQVNLTWKGSSVSSNIVAYTVYFGPTSNPDSFKSQIKDSFVNNVAVSTNTTYYWRVVSIDSNGNISDSGTYNFFVK